MTRGQAFPSTYLSKEDVNAPFVATIDCVQIAELKNDDGSEQKPVLHWLDAQVKPMILNNTNWMVLEVAYGPDSDGWVGKTIEVFVDPTVMFGKKAVGGVRLRMPVGKPSNGGMWTFKQAVAEAGKWGLTEAQVVAAIKAAGGQGWKAERDMAVVQKLIEGAGSEEIPFGNEVAV